MVLSVRISRQANSTYYRYMASSMTARHINVTSPSMCGNVSLALLLENVPGRPWSDHTRRLADHVRGTLSVSIGWLQLPGVQSSTISQWSFTFYGPQYGRVSSALRDKSLTELVYKGAEKWKLIFWTMTNTRSLYDVLFYGWVNYGMRLPLTFIRLQYDVEYAHNMASRNVIRNVIIFATKLRSNVIPHVRSDQIRKSLMRSWQTATIT